MAPSSNHRRYKAVTLNDFVSFEEFRVEADFSSPIPRLFKVSAPSRHLTSGEFCCASHSLRLAYSASTRSTDSSARGRSLCTDGVAPDPGKERCAVVAPTGNQLRTALVMTTLNWEFSAADLRDASDAWPAGPAVADCPHQPYSEEAFRYFLGLERKRAERSRRSLLLLLVNLTVDDEGGETIPPAISSKLFSGLSLCVRDVDFIGWYRHGRVAGAVLTQGTDSPALEASEQIGGRVKQLLAKRLPAGVTERLQVRVLQARQTVQG